MENFQNFTEVDYFFYKLFANKKSPLAHLKYKGVAILIGLQHNVYEYFRSFVYNESKEGFLNTKRSMLAINGIDHKLKLLLNRFVSQDYSVLTDKTVFFADNYVPRILQDFLKIIEKRKTHEVVFCTTDYRAFSYMNKELQNSGVVCRLLKTSNLRSGGQQKKIFKNQLNKLMDSWLPEIFGKHTKSVRRIIKSNIGVLMDYFEMFEFYLSAYKPKNILIGSDGFSIARMLCLASKKVGVETYVLQHGLIDTLNGYLPLVADKIFLWSKQERDIFIKHEIPADQLLITGTPRFDINVSHKEIEKQEPKQVLFVLCPCTVEDVYHQINLAVALRSKLNLSYDIVVRPHPYYRAIAETYFAKFSNESKLILDKSAFIQSISNSELVVFADISTGVFEAITVCKNVYILKDEKTSKMNIYDLPKLPISLLVNELNRGDLGIKGYNLSERGFNDAEVRNASEIINSYLNEEKKKMLTLV